MKTFKFSLMLRTRENTDVFISLDHNIYGIHSKRINILYVFILGKAVKLLLKAVFFKRKIKSKSEYLQKGIYDPGKIWLESIGINGTGNAFANHNRHNIVITWSVAWVKKGLYDLQALFNSVIHILKCNHMNTQQPNLVHNGRTVITTFFRGD